MVFEGFGVDHAHAKLFPMHGTAGIKTWPSIKSSVEKYFSRYEGYISSHDGASANPEELEALMRHLRGEQT